MSGGNNISFSFEGSKIIMHVGSVAFNTHFEMWEVSDLIYNVKRNIRDIRDNIGDNKSSFSGELGTCVRDHMGRDFILFKIIYNSENDFVEILYRVEQMTLMGGGEEVKCKKQFYKVDLNLRIRTEHFLTMSI
jgi:hypothetical protein